MNLKIEVLIMKIYESGEDYLETILILNEEKGCVRAIDVAQKLDFSRPSVSRAISILKKMDYVLIDEKGYIVLTDLGRKIAKKIYDRHCFLIKCFKFLGVSDYVAKIDACRVEHAMSEETFEKLKKFFDDYLI